MLLVLQAALTLAHADPQGTWKVLVDLSYDLVFLLGAVACLLRGRRIGAERTAWTVFGIGLLLSAAGYTYDTITTSLLEQTPSFPGPADFLWTALYPFAYVGVLQLARVRTGRHSAVAADAGIAALALASLAAIVVVPPLIHGGGDVGTTITNVIYPLADLHLCAFVVWTWFLGGRRLGHAWPMLAATVGLAVVVDAFYLVQITQGSYHGGIIDLGWPAVALGYSVLPFLRPGSGAPMPAEPRALRLSVPVVSALIAVGLVFAEALEEPELMLAALTLLCAVVRSARVAAAARRLQGEVAGKTAQLAEAQELTHVGSAELDLRTGRREWSDQLCRIYGLDPAAERPATLDALQLIHRDDRERVAASIDACCESGVAFEENVRVIRADGQLRHVEMRGKRTGSLVHASVQDVTQRRLVEERLRDSERRYRLVVESAQDGIWLMDKERRTTFVNQRAAEIVGRDAGDLLGRDPIDFMTAESRAGVAEHRASRDPDTRTTYEGCFVRPDGGLVWVAASISPVLDEHEAGSMAVITDITARKQLEADLRRAAEYDALTGLPNRARFESALGERTAAGGRFAVAMVDLDHIKFVNDSFGHAAGDEVLCHTAEVIQSVLREGDIVARFGGDEFAVLVDHADEDAAIAAIERVLGAVRESRWRGARQSASAGIAMAREGTFVPALDLFRAADQALYEAKAKGRDRAVVYRGHDGGLAWVEEVRAAIAEERLTLYSQKLIDLRGGPDREELLVRMLSPEGDLLPPSAFIPTAEQFGLITDIDRWVVARGLELARSGRAVEINVSGASLGESCIAKLVAEAVHAGVDPALLTFEITETAAVRNLDEARRFAEELTALGCGVALDDFGTGYGSLTYLRHLPITQIKLDIEFIRDLGRNPEARTMVEAVVGMARTLGKETVAEGVEDIEVLAILREIGVDFAQGYAIHRPSAVATDRNPSVSAGR